MICSLTLLGCGGYEQTIKSETNSTEVNSEVQHQYFTTSDSVQLHYTVSGKGPALVILPGYGQDATKFSELHSLLEKNYTTYTLDYRWLGLSDSPQYGAHISRFAMDAREMIKDAGIDDFYLFAHSMGNTVAWNYFSLFGQDNVNKYILGDEAPTLITDPAWTPLQNETYTGSPQEKNLWTAWRNPEIIGEQKSEKSLRDEMLTRLLTTHLSNDWRDIVPTIKIPTLIVMGGESHFNSPLLWYWLNENIQGSTLEIMEEAGHGFYESHPEEFARLVKDFFN